MENSGLPSGDTESGTTVTSTSRTELIPVAPVPVTCTSYQQGPITQTVTTMTLQDAATGSVKKHIIRKVKVHCIDCAIYLLHIL